MVEYWSDDTALSNEYVKNLMVGNRFQMIYYNLCYNNDPGEQEIQVQEESAESGEN